ncbi:MAG: hypothetical protein NUV46_01950 [Nanoarchaeota archaeon]|nr:hypothetical protein [Nanoarchaeota archaeon]
MKTFFAIILFFFLLVGSISALEINGKNVSCEDFESFNENFGGKGVPSSIPYQNEILNVYIKNESFGHIKVEKGNFSNFSCEKSDNATYDLKINNLSIFENLDSNQSLIETLNKKLSDKEIEVEGLTLGKKIKWFFTTILLKVLGWF